MMRKILLGAVALAALGAAPSRAEPPAASGMAGMAGMHRGWHASAEDAGAYLDARIAALKAGIRLTPEQDKAWPAFEQAYRDLARMRIERAQTRAAREGQGREAGGRDGGQPAADPIARLASRADQLSARGAALKRLADAAAPLYGSLDDAQKHRFAMLSHMMGPHRGMSRHGRGMGANGMGGHRMGMGGHGMDGGRMRAQDQD